MLLCTSVPIISFAGTDYYQGEFTITHYCPCKKCCGKNPWDKGYGITATGTVPKYGTIAVDPTVIPYGTKVYIKELDKVFTAEDCGGAIKGNKIDIFMTSEKACNDWGVRNITIEILK